MTDELYREWLEARRRISPPETLADQIMQAAERQGAELPVDWRRRLVCRMENSPAARWAFCGSALAVGCLPFLFLAHFAKLVSF